MTVDPYPLDKDNTEVPPRIRLTGGEYPQQAGPLDRTLDPGGERPPVIPQRNADAGDLAFDVAQADQKPPPQFDDWLEVPFSPRLRKHSDDKYYCMPWAGFVEHVRTSTDGDRIGSADPHGHITAVIGQFMPEGLDTWAINHTQAVPEWEVKDGQTLLIEVKTDPKDVPTDVQVVVKDNGSWTNIHAQPPPVEEGYEDDSSSDPTPPPCDGDYFYPICDFAKDGARNLQIAHVYRKGTIEHVGVLKEFWNRTGSGEGTLYRIFAKWNGHEDRYEFRGIFQLKPASSSASDPDKDMVPVIWPFQAGEPPYDLIRWRGLRGRSAYDTKEAGDDDYVTPQIQVKSKPAARAIRIIGNGKVGSLTFLDADYPYTQLAKIEWNDGLMITSGDQTVYVDNDDDSSSWGEI